MKEYHYYVCLRMEEDIGLSRLIRTYFPCHTTFHYHWLIFSAPLHYAWRSCVTQLSQYLDYAGNFEESRLKEVLRKRKVSCAPIPGRNECIYHSTSNGIRRSSVDEIHSRTMRNEEECYVEMVPSSKLGLNTYGHLKIDYSNSWDSLHRKISK